jgi:ribosomal protein S18 acetylase RimI-like enzyme
MSFKIREGRRQDAVDVADVYVESRRAAYAELLTPEQIENQTPKEGARLWQALFNQARTIHLVIEDGEGIGGFITAGPIQESGADPASAEIYELYVHPRLWGQGVSDELLQKTLDALRAKWFTHAVIWVLEGNALARKFYEGAGWTDDGGRRGSFRKVDVASMRYRMGL